MADTLRVLYVDDESDLLSIGKLFLEQSGDFAVTTALSAPEALRVLEQEKFDAIISDYQMPGMDGIQFLSEVRTRFGPIPFILFTGRGREEVVIQAINSGADFYLQKGGDPRAQFAELTHKIKAATSSKRGDDALRKSEEKYRHLIEHANEAIVVVQDGMPKLVNHKTIEITGYSEQELLSMPISTFIHHEDRAMVVERYQKRMRGEGGPSRYAFRLSSKDGCTRWVDISVSAIDWEGHPATLNFLTDITDRKRSDDSLRVEQQFSKLILDSLPGIFYLYTYPENRMVRWNKQHETLLGYTAEEIKGKLGTDLHLPEYKDAVLKAIDEVMEKGQSSVESTLLAKDGRLIPFFFTGVRFEAPGQLYFMGIGIDITERKQAEDALLKNSEELHAAYEELTASQEELRQNVNDLIRSGQALRESENRYRLIDDASLDYIYSYDLGGHFTSANRSLCTAMMLGCDQILGRTHAELGFPDAQCRDWDDLHRKVYDTGTTVTSLTSTPMPDGSIRHYEVVLNPIRDNDGTITGIAGTTRDITDRKHAEEALAESEGLLKTVVTNLHGIVFSVDKEGIFLLSDGRSLSMLGLKPGQVVGQSVFDVYKDVPEIIAGMKTALSGNPWSGICHVQGIFFDTVVTPVFDSSKMVSGAVGIATDITGRKCAEEELLRKNEELNASFEEIAATEEELRQNLDELTRQEEALRESKRELADIIEFLPDATFVIDRQAIVIAWNRAMEELTGIRAEDMLGKGNYEYAIPFYGERRPILIDLVMIQDQDVLNTYSSVQKEGDSLTAETGMAHLGGKNLLLWGKAILIKNFHGEVVGAIESIRDITAWKHAEKKLLSTQEYLKEAHRLAGIGTWDWVIETDTVTWSEELCNISGWDPSLPEPTYAELPRIYTPASWERLSAAVTNALNTGEPYNLELELIRPDGSIRRTYASGAVIRDTKGKITGLHGTLQDITERKRVDEALRESEERFRGIFDTITSGVAIYEVMNDGASGKDYIIKDFNKTALEIEGKKKDEVVGKSLFDLRPAIDDYGLIPVFQQVWKTGIPVYFPQTAYIDENYSSWYENRVFRLHSGEIVAVYDDVTERKVAEEALRESEVQFRSYVDSAPEGIFIADEKGYYIFVNDAACITTGYTREELLSKNLGDVIFPEDIPKAGEHFQRIVTTGSASGELRFITRNGEVRWWVVKGVRLSPTRFLGFTSDTTERKQVEEALALTQSRLESSMEAGNIAWWEMDCITGNVRFNERKARMLGYPAEQFSHYSDFTKLLHPDDYEPAMQAMREHLCGIRKQYEVDYRISASNGGFLWFHDIGRISDYAPDGKPLKVTGIVIDITGRKAAEETLRNSEEYYRTIIQTTKDGFWIINAHSGRFMDVNETYCAMSGYTKTELLDMGINDIDSVEDPVTTKNRIQRILTNGSELFETRHRRKDGSLLDVEVSVTYFPAEGGNFICFCRDITRRKVAEEALQESELRLKDIIAFSPDATLVIDKNGEVLAWNRAMEVMTGVPADQMIGKADYEYALPFYHERCPITVDLVLDDELAAGAKYPVIKKEGKSLYSEIFIPHLNNGRGAHLWFMASPLYDMAGNLTGAIETIRDITERKVAEAAITESFAIFKTVMDSLDALVYVSDMKTHEVLFINQYGKEIFGDITGKICWKSIQKDQDGPCPFCTNEKLMDLEGNPAGIIVWEFKNTINGHWYECHDSAIRWTDGRIVRIEIASDITERKRVLEALVESESFNRNLVENLPDYISVYGMDGTLLYVNPASARTLGYDADTLIGTHVLSYIAEEYHETAIAKMRARLEGHEVSPYEIEMVTRNGPRKSVIVKAAPVQYQDNPATLLLLIDITERKQAEEALRQLSDRLSLATRAGGVGIWDFDVVNNTLTWDDQMFALYGITKGQFSDAYEAWQAGLPPEDKQRCDDEVQMALRGEKEFDTEFCVLWPDGSTRTIRAFALVQRDAGGKPLRMIGTNWDISERKELETEMKYHEQELMQFTKSLASANKKLTLLSSITRHDINNQLTVLMGFLAILKKKHPDTIHNEYFQKISAAAQRISSMIQFTGEYEKIGVNAPIWQDCRTLVDNAAKEAPLGKVIVRNDLAAGAEVFADPLVVKVFYNLMDNAVRYGGKITTIRFSATDSGDDLVIVCEDDGDGIVAEEKEKIFERGFGKNTGLGLALSREILSITGITIVETGEPGKGARFEMTVPNGAWRTAGKGD